MERPSTTGDQFADLGSSYEEFSGTPFRRFLEVPSVLGVVGDVRGKAVFDLGCGAGDYTRWLRQRGAARVVGYDVSAGMSEYARRRERTHGADFWEPYLRQPHAAIISGRRHAPASHI